MIHKVSYSSNSKTPVTIEFHFKWIESADMIRPGSRLGMIHQCRFENHFFGIMASSHVLPNQFLTCETTTEQFPKNSHLTNLINEKTPEESQNYENIPGKSHGQLYDWKKSHF
jgi:hypothetical protein